MLYWYPKIKDLDIPQPKTIIIKVNPKVAFDVIDGKGTYPEVDKFIEATRCLVCLYLLEQTRCQGSMNGIKLVILTLRFPPIPLFSVISTLL